MAKGTTVAKYLSDRFDFYYNRENVFTKLDTPYESSGIKDPDTQYGGGATAQWKLGADGYLTAVFSGNGGEIFRKSTSMVVKGTDGTAASMKDFVTEFDVSLNTNIKSAVALNFRSQDAGRMVTAYNKSYAGKDTLLIGNHGFAFYDGTAPIYASPFADAANYTAWNGNAAVTKAHVYVKALGNKMILKVTGTDGTVYYNNAANPITLSYDHTGSLYYSVLNATAGLANICIDRLDENGKVGVWSPSTFTQDINGALGYDASTGKYPSGANWVTYNNAAVAEYTAAYVNGMDSKFGVYYNDYNGTNATYLANKSIVGNTLGYNYSNIYNNQYIQESAAGIAGATGDAMRFVGSLVPKTSDGAPRLLKNFALSTRVEFGGNTKNGMFVFGFRQAEPGKYFDDNGVSANQCYLAMSVDGVKVFSNGQVVHEAAFGGEFIQSGVSGYTHYAKVDLKVVNDTLTYTITPDRQDIQHTLTGTVTLNRTTAGYLALSHTNNRNHFGMKPITVTALDNSGNVVDWNETAQQVIPSTYSFSFSGLTTYVDANNAVQGTTETRDAYINKFENAFDVYYNDYASGAYTFVKNHIVGNNIGYNYGKITANWIELYPRITGYGDDTFARPQTEMRQIGSLVPKDTDGEQLSLKNFQLEVQMLQHMGSDVSTYGSHIIGFRMETAGKFLNNDGTPANGDYMLINTSGVKIYENGVLRSEKNFSTAQKDATMALTLRVVGKTLTYTVTTNKGGGTLTDTVALQDETTGFLSLSQSTVRHLYNLNSGLSITALDANGAEKPLKGAKSDYENGNVTTKITPSGNMITTTVTLTPDEGYQLRAGTLIAVDENGDRYIPTRVGFRNGGKGDQYVVVAPTTVKFIAQFVQPTASEPNMGNIGVSTNESLHGLRLISRINRTVENGVSYMLIDGQKKAIKDYGLIIGTEPVVGKQPMTLELTETNQRVKRISFPQKNVYFDTCDDYVDMSVCVTNMDKVAGALGINVLSRPYAIIDDGTADGQVLYIDSFGSNYEEARGIKTATISAMNTNSQLLVQGRADVIGNELQMDWVNTGFQIKGQLFDNVKLQTTSTRADSLLNVSVDGNAPKIVHVPQGDATVTIATNLPSGEHTIDVVSGTSLRQGTLSATALQYNGTLETVQRDSAKLRMSVLGDSISCGWGLGVAKGATATNVELIAGSNSYNSYAAITARSLNADLDVVAQCSQTISEIDGYAAKLNRRSGAPAWDYSKNAADVVVINLGTNDQWRSGYQDPAKALTDATAILADARTNHPDAYIIWTYGMMSAQDAFVASYTTAINNMKAAGDNKVFLLNLAPYTDQLGYESHPTAAAHQACANALTSFIRTNCTDCFTNAATATATPVALKNASKALFTGRTATANDSLSVKCNNSGITLQGFLYGDMDITMTITDERGVTVNVVIDGDADHANVLHLNKGTNTLRAYTGLRRGNHTVEITRGTALNYSYYYTIDSIKYTGTLTTPVEKDLQIAFYGDSITCGDGMYGIGYTVEGHNSLYTYAAITARNLDAGMSAVAACGFKTAQIEAKVNNTIDWGTDTTDKDIVVINLGTNDTWNRTLDETALAQLKTDCQTMVSTVRAKYANAYIVWIYGAITREYESVIQGAVEEMAATDAKLFYHQVPQRNAGSGKHPDLAGHADIAADLTAYLQTTCADILG